MLAIRPTLAFPLRIRCPPDCFFADVGHFMPSLTPELGREAKVPDGHRDRTATKAIEARSSGFDRSGRVRCPNAECLPPDIFESMRSSRLMNVRFRTWNNVRYRALAHFNGSYAVAGIIEFYQH
jgi:hypothetical protein